MVGKITISNLGCIPAAAVVEGQTSPIARIYGIASGIKSVVDKNRGDVYESITGSFEGVNLKTGNIYQASVVYLPAGIHGLLENAVKGIVDEAGKQQFNSVKFALEIGVVKAKNPAGYSYEAKSLVPAVVDDPLAEMRTAISGHGAKQIEAGKPTKR
jgi:hypothetical protein